MSASLVGSEMCIRDRVDALPPRFRATCVVPMRSAITVVMAKTVQCAMVDVWQRHVQDFYEGDVLRLADPTVAGQPSSGPSSGGSASSSAAALSSSTPSSSSSVIAAPVRPESEQNGHVLAPRVRGGLWCVKCGKQTQEVKH
eukprot:10676769-Alexandrium_andersonii.AAC.1